jgi:hypothetical protein
MVKVTLMTARLQPCMEYIDTFIFMFYPQHALALLTRPLLVSKQMLKYSMSEANVMEPTSLGSDMLVEFWSFKPHLIG